MNNAVNEAITTADLVELAECFAELLDQGRTTKSAVLDGVRLDHFMALAGQDTPGFSIEAAYRNVTAELARRGASRSR